MNSSGMKRGLAATAISALAVTGLPFLATSATAVTNASQYGADEVQLLSQYSGAASTKNDGTNSTIRLEAGAGADVSGVQFQYSNDGGATWINIGGVTPRNDDGAFSLEWDAAGLGGASVTLRAMSVNGTTSDPDASDERASVEITGQGLAPESVNLTDGSSKGAFQAPYTDDDGDAIDESATTPSGDYVVLDGTTSATSGSVALSHFFESGDPIAAGTAAVTAPSGATTGTFAGIADITGYDFTGSPDELSFGAQRDSDDVEAYALYQQTIGTVTASPTSANQPSSDPTAEITITVTDQNGAPIANAEVRRSNGDLVGYTDEAGQIVAQQGSGTQYYYANQTDSNPYEPSVGDKRSDDVTVTPFTPEPTSLQGKSNDGAAFDFDEYDGADDITVQIKDQFGNDTDGTGQTLSYHWVITPFDGTAQVRVPAGTDESTAQDLDDDGEYVVAFPTGQKEGTYELFASLGEVPIQGGDAIAESKVLTVKAGESQVAYDEASPEVAPAGTTEAVTGKLVLDDGTALGGRGLEFTYDSAGNASIQESSGTANDGIVTTAGDGSFSFNVVDPSASPQTTERGTLLVDPVNATNDNDNVGADIDPDDQEVVFASAGAPAGSSVTITPDNTEATAGETQDVTVTVDSNPATPAVDAVANTTVTLKVDEGFFTNEDGTTNLGQEITVVTDSNGVATADIGINRNEGFDDDGQVTSTVTATSGAASDTEDYEWTSENPLNGGEVDLMFSPAALQTVGVLPKAPFETESVCFDVIVTDEFGNPVAGENVDVSDNTGLAGISDSNFNTDLVANCDFVASASAAVDQEITVTWDAPSTATPPVTADLEDSETVNWYAIDPANSTFSLTAAGSDPRPVGSTVTMTYKAVDQNGEPIDGYDVDFFRAGPDDEGDGEENDFNQTNGQGEAYYVFQGENRGTATVSAVLYDTEGTIVPEGAETATARFGKRRIAAALTLRGKDNGGKDDRLLANAHRKTEGARVKLFRKRKDGTWKLIDRARMNDRGNHKFRVNDRNGNKGTRYKAVVKRTDDTKRGVGKKRVR